MTVCIDIFGVTNLFTACLYLAVQTIFYKFIFTPGLIITLSKTLNKFRKLFIHGVYKEVKKPVLSGMRVNFSICAG